MALTYHYVRPGGGGCAPYWSLQTQPTGGGAVVGTFELTFSFLNNQNEPESQTVDVPWNVTATALKGLIDAHFPGYTYTGGPLDQQNIKIDPGSEQLVLFSIGMNDMVSARPYIIRYN